MNRWTSQLPLLVIALLCVAAVATGSALISLTPTDKSGAASASTYILGPARSLLSAGLYERADVYFHKGATYEKEEAFHGFFQKWKESITPTEHAHTQGRETEEILPWLRLATQSDPHNIEVYLVASFWLSGDCQRPDLAQQALDEAIEKNPGRYELSLEKGRIYLAMGEYEPALNALQKASELIALPNQINPDQAAIDLPFIPMAQSYLFEVLDRREDAIMATERLLALRSSEHFSERLEKLRSAPLDPDGAKDRLGELFHKTHDCDREDHDHEHDGHVHGPDCNHDDHVHGPDCNHDDHVHGPDCNHE